MVEVVRVLQLMYGLSGHFKKTCGKRRQMEKNIKALK